MAFAHASSKMALPFLRPMALPRPATINHFLGVARVSTTTAKEYPPLNLAMAPPPTTEHNKPYRILRTPSNQYPVYTMKKRGGNMKLTKLRKIEGDVNALKTDLQEALGVDRKEVVVNQLTRQIVVKGHKRPEIVKFLEERAL